MNIVKNLFIILLLMSCTHAAPGISSIISEGEITEQERQQATNDLIAILKDVPYFEFVNSRIHGIPETNSDNQFWWGHWWTGVQIQKIGGRVSYVHSITGSDNTGIQTSPYLEGACYAFLLTKDPKYEKLARKMIRGMSAWILSSAKSKDDTPTILSRAFYPKSLSSNEEGFEIFLNYDANRPGKFNGVSEYVHNPGNPFFGDIYLKNNRSTDDIGHMLRAIANVQSCRNTFSEETKADFDQMKSLYYSWAKSVDDNNFIIPTYNTKLEVVTKAKSIDDYNTYNYGLFDPACVEKLSVRLMHSDNAGNLKCGRGISFLEKLFSKQLQNDAIEILRSHHLAAFALAKLKSQNELASELKKGIEERVDRDFSVIKNPKSAPKFDLQDILSFLVQANNIGVTLKSDQQRFLYEKLHYARTALLRSENFNTFHVFDSNVPDGNYNFDPPHSGLYFYAIGTLIGTCTSIYSDPNARSLFNCDELRDGLLKN